MITHTRLLVLTGTVVAVILGVGGLALAVGDDTPDPTTTPTTAPNTTPTDGPDNNTDDDAVGDDEN